jgi:hypothetical protein
VFDEIPHSEKVLKRHQNSDDPCIMAWDHYTWRTILLSGSSNILKKPRNLYFSNQVYHRNDKEVQNGILQTNYHSHANQLQVEKI